MQFACIIQAMNKSKPNNERTLVIVKPDGIQRTLVGEIIGRYERIGLKLVGIKMMVATADLIEKHYTLDPEWRMVTGLKTIKGYKDKGLVPPQSDPMEVTGLLLKKLVKYMTSGPVIAMVWQGPHAVQIVRKITGTTEPLMSDVGTIRGDYMLDSYQLSDMSTRSLRNLIHSSGSVKEAEDEIAHWFTPRELVNYKLVQESVMTDDNMNEIIS